MAYCRDCASFYVVNGEYRCSYHEIELPYSDYNACGYFRSNDSSASRGGGCFLTSACVAYMKKPDDCEELTVLRNFRDGYMAKTEEGKALIEEYYAIAPAIVQKIESSNKADEYYKDVYQTVLRCVQAIQKGENENAVALYKQMVLKYQAI